MKNIIKPDPISLTTHHLHTGLKETDSIISSGTGFLYKNNASCFLITNWHVVTGRNPMTGKCLSDTLAIPDMLSTLFRDKEKPGSCKRENIDLYSDAQMKEPLWLEHPEFGNKVDVVAIKLPEFVTESYKLYAINDIDFDSQFKEEVSDDIFVIGYPFSDITYMQLPIWKKASIASEPDINIDQLPKLLIDTATRPGLSGSPVIMQRIGIHGMENGIPKGSDIMGRIRKFTGVYSGRIGEGEVMAQLGIVWKERVIHEIIDAGVIGSSIIEV